MWQGIQIGIFCLPDQNSGEWSSDHWWSSPWFYNLCNVTGGERVLPLQVLPQCHANIYALINMDDALDIVVYMMHTGDKYHEVYLIRKH